MCSMPRKMRRSKFSLKTNQASIEVNTPSMLSSSEAAEAEMLLSPTISSKGPATPPAAIAPASHGGSWPVSATGRSCALRMASARTA